MKKWSLNFRLWHWIHATVILGLLGTVFLRKTFLSWRANSEILAQKLLEFNIEVTADQAKALAKAVRSPMWEWHIILGYMLVALLLWRIALFFTKSGKENYVAFKDKDLHKKLVSLGYIFIYLVLAFMAVSGVVLEFYKDLGILKSTAHDIKDAHEFMYQAILIFVPLHLIGLFIAQRREDENVIKDML